MKKYLLALLGLLFLASPSFPQERETGYTPNPEAVKAYLEEVGRLGLYSEYKIASDPKIETVLLYRHYVKAFKAQIASGNKEIAQVPYWINQGQVGSCVGCAAAHSAGISLAADYSYRGAADYWAPVSGEACYGGSRVEARGLSVNPGGDGSSGAAAANYFKKFGLVFAKKYPDLGLDLSTYSARTAKDMGRYGTGGAKDGGKLDDIARKHPVPMAALVRNWDDLVSALQNRHAVLVCSMQGFASVRDKDGFLAPSGQWAHAMCICGYRSKPEPGVLILNSWGPDWVSGPHWPEDAPKGSFWVRKSVVERMIGFSVVSGGKRWSMQDTWVIPGPTGFQKRELKNDEGWADPVYLKDMDHAGRNQKDSLNSNVGADSMDLLRLSL